MVVFVSLIISVDGFFQHLYGYEEHLQSALNQTTRDWIFALSGRVFSRFALPSQLAGYLLMILPLNLLLVLQVRSIWEKIFWGGGFLLNGLIFLYTKSFGAWLSCLCAAAISGYLFVSRKHTIAWRTVLKGSVLFIIGGWGVLYLIGAIRGHYLWDFQGNNPLWYRLLNWKTALHIFLNHPFLGTGLFTFGKMYPHYMLPGANESQYAHNSYLQIGAELGFIGLVSVVWLTGYWGISAITLLRKWKQNRSKDHTQENHIREQYGFSFFCGGLAFLLHNVIDFDVYVFPLGVLGVSLLALTVNVLSPSVPEKNHRNRLKSSRVLAGYGFIGCALLVMYFMDWRSVHSQQQRENAVAFMQSSQYENAYTQIRNALQYAPGVADYMALEGNILLYLNKSDPAIQCFQSAIQDEPDTPWFHAGLAEAYIISHNISMGYVESRRAAELFPQKLPYQKRVQEIQALFPTR
jgi:tetratricopeptide (TPR) repeat protein